MSGPDAARRPADQAELAALQGQGSRRYRELREVPATDQAIRAVPPGLPRRQPRALPAHSPSAVPDIGRQGSSHG
jgi:hypothetical protein